MGCGLKIIFIDYETEEKPDTYNKFYSRTLPNKFNTNKKIRLLHDTNQVALVWLRSPRTAPIWLYPSPLTDSLVNWTGMPKRGVKPCKLL
jgi:hypothetical protein